MKEVNPLKALRTRSHLTMDAVAEAAGVSRQYVIRAEQAVFKELPLAVAETLLDLVEDPPDLGVLDALYNDWQRLRREESYGSLVLNFDFHNHDGAPNSGVLHPFTHWRGHSGITARIQVSKLFCVHPALIFKFEEQPWLVSTPPGELLVGLRQAGYTRESLDLAEAYYRYRKARRVDS